MPDWQPLWNCCHRCKRQDIPLLQWGWFSYCRDCFLTEISDDLLIAVAQHPD